MLPNPLHPAVVHFPIAFAFLLPPTALVALLWSARAGKPRAIWWPVAALMLLSLVSGVVALKSGEATEDRVEQVVAKRLIHEHEERAEGFMVAAWIGLALAAAGFLKGRLGAAARWAFLAAALVMVAQVTWTGKLGGALVYEHGAASAYARPAAPQPAVHGEDNEH
ncbi:hypothetical protein FJ251_09740 [bacterium]|nr:hypothetical protein [bacterium]